MSQLIVRTLKSLSFLLGNFHRDLKNRITYFSDTVIFQQILVLFLGHQSVYSIVKQEFSDQEKGYREEIFPVIHKNSTHWQSENRSRMVTDYVRREYRLA